MKRVLIIDDDESILDAVRLVLEEKGYMVETLAKGEDTHKLVASFKPDVILLDLLISGSDGRDICKNLKENSDTRNIPITIISAHPSAEKVAIEAGADEFLAKPFDVQTLLKKLHVISPLSK